MSIDKEQGFSPLAPDQEREVANPDQIYVDWIIKALEQSRAQGTGLTRKGVAKALGLDGAAITRMLTGRRRIKTDEIKKVAAYLGANPPQAEFPSQSPESHTAQIGEPVSVTYAHVRGETAGGRWLEYEIGDQPYDDVPLVPNRFGKLEQFAYRVSGNSMDKLKILDGDYVVCVPYFEARSTITDGDIVVVQRSRAGLYERTCKQLTVTRTQVELSSRSTDPRHEEPVFTTGQAQEDDGIEVEIIGLVVGRYAPIGSAN